ncbi:glycosyltransferase family 2 protein [Paenibacillus sp. MMS18-CY102]|uniref:glycosyltransferase family 2 protein n=1 Tax=Paenibacillus sp. MMS18-CY102 TaxID=2682849 RepID=UPI001365AF48|nr:glycosyltransferase [Paenibacillus sp. MMS18-CY102]MWC27304.1 glycosyltransferase [Paenibacillus sp. MMS18-CY102]
MDFGYKFWKLLIRFHIFMNFRTVLFGRKWYDKWIERNEQFDLEKAECEINTFLQKPLISIILPVYNIKEVYLRECVESVLNQVYPYWELCIADDCSTLPHIRHVLDEFASKDSRIRVTYRMQNGHISACSNTAIDQARGDFIAFLDHDDLLTVNAIYEVVKSINNDPNVDLLFSNEDKWINGRRERPFFKRKWGRELLRQMNFVCHLSVYRTSLVKELGGLKVGLEGAQDWDLALRVMAKTDRIHHIPKVLYHWRVIEGSTSSGEGEKPYVREIQHKVKQASKIIE